MAAEDLGIHGIDQIESLDIEGSAIYRARQPLHNRAVVVKILDPHQDPLIPRRFDIRRKRLSKFAEHPGVVSLYEYGVSASGQQYLIMPYFRIGSLADQLSHGPMPWHRAAQLIVRTAETVAAAHDLDLVLGDIKPSSILLADASSPLVAVYGMATRRFDNGSPAYCAPETQLGAPLTPSADVYGLALTLAALIAGRAPNRGTPSPEFMAEVRSLAADRIYQVIEHGLAPNETNRYGSGRHLALGLAGAINGDPVGPPGARVTPQAEPFDLDELLGPPAPSAPAAAPTSNGSSTEVIDLTDKPSPSTPPKPPGEPNGSHRPTPEQRPGPRKPGPVREPERVIDLRTPAPGTSTERPPVPATSAVAAFDQAAPASRGVSGELEQGFRVVTAKAPAPGPAVSFEPEPTDAHPAVARADGAAPGHAASTNGTLDPISTEPEPTAAHPAVGARDATDRAAAAPPDAAQPEPTDAHPAVGARDATDRAASAPPDAAQPEPTDAHPAVGARDATDRAGPPPPDAAQPEPTDAHPAVGNPRSPAGEPPHPPAAAAAAAAAAAQAPPNQAPPNQAPPNQAPPNQAPPNQAPSSHRPAARPPSIHLPEGATPTTSRPAARPPGNARPASLAPAAYAATTQAAPARVADIEPPAGRPPAGPAGPPHHPPAPPGQGPARSGNDRWNGSLPGEDDAASVGPGRTARSQPPSLLGLGQDGAGQQARPPSPGHGPRPHRIPVDEPMPFRNFDRRDSLAPSGHRLSAILEPFHAALFNRRQSFGAMLGVAGLAIIAGLVVLLVVRDLRPTSTGTGANGPAVDSDESIPSGPPPTSIAPILAEPPSTHLTSTARRSEETTTTESTTTSEETTTTESTTTSEETTTTESSTTRRPTTTKPPSTTIDPTTTEDGTTTSDPPPTGGNDPEGPTVPLIQSAAVTQVRATTARIGFTSPACVTASFSYAPVGQSATVIGGGSRCSRSHALLLGLVTPPLEPGTTYRVTIEATDADGLSTRRTLSFITLG